MRLLLDTHAFLWFALDDHQLSAAARILIEDPSHECLISPASYWEIAIKISVGKYSLQESYLNLMGRVIKGNRFTVLPIEPSHTAELINLPQHHRDPFDGLLIAQAIVELTPIVSGDKSLDAFPITRLW